MNGTIIINSTRIPDDVLVPIVDAALVFADCRPGIVVQIRESKRVLRGEAWGACSLDYKDFTKATRERAFELARIKSRRLDNSSHQHRRISTDFGTFAMFVPVMNWKISPRFLAECFFTISCHEAKHVADHQLGLKFARANSRTGRRQKWETRPEEIRANAVEKEAVKALKCGALPRVAESIDHLERVIQYVRSQESM